MAKQKKVKKADKEKETPGITHLSSSITSEAKADQSKIEEIIPGIPDSSSSITKGAKAAHLKTEKVMDKEKGFASLTAEEVIPGIPDLSSITKGQKGGRLKTEEVTGKVFPSEKKDKEALSKQEKEPAARAEGIEDSVKEKEDEEKAITAEKESFITGKTYDITEEDKLVSAEGKTEVSPEKGEIEPEGEVLHPEYEVKMKGSAGKDEIRHEETSSYVPEGSGSIMGKKTTFKSEEEKTEEVKGTTSTVEKEKSKAAGIFVSLKQGGSKVAGVVAKSFRPSKLNIQKSVGVVIAASKNPIKTVSAIDRKVTKSMKKVVVSGSKNIGGKSILQNIRTYDESITRSAKKLIDSVIK